MRKVLLIFVAAMLLPGTTTMAAGGFDFAAAERRFAAVHLPSTSLHEAERGPDGARGYGMAIPQGLMAAPPTSPPPPFSTMREWYTHGQYCGWDAIVRATLLDSTPVLTANKSLIYTVSHFAVVDVLKSDAPFRKGERMLVYRVGGELVDDGEKLMVDTTQDMAPFKPQRSYILILDRDKGASARQYYIPEMQTILVRDEYVYPISGRWAWLSNTKAFPWGTSYADIQGTFRKVSRVVCPKSGSRGPVL